MSEPITYTLRFPAPQTHYIEVEAQVPTAGLEGVELMMPVWTPGSYLVREYARNVEAVEARGPGGEPLAVHKTEKNRWRLATGGAATVRVTYRVYCREMSVRTNFVDSRFALLNGAATFLTLADDPGRPHMVHLELPASWETSVSALPRPEGAGPHTYRARNLDHLIDSPIYAGSPALYEIDVDGTPHLLANEGEGGIWDGPRSAADAAAIIRAEKRLWGAFPYERYLFLNLITEARGGLEHAASSVLMTSRWKTRSRQEYLGWLSLVSHELFHAWNGKRLRPVELGPFDYEREELTRSLWVVEGITAYYDDLLVHRAGLSTREEYLKALSKTIERLQTTPGRRVQPLERASFDAWIKLYRRDENSRNSSISYYVKGAVVAWLLDMEVRRATAGARSLDDVLRRAYERFSGERGYRGEDIRAVVQEVAGVDLCSFLHRALETTEELAYEGALEWLGLQFTTEEVANGKRRDEDEHGWLGLVTEDRGGLLVVTEVPRETPAFAAGFNVDDEIVAVDGYRVTAATWEGRTKAYPPGTEAEVMVARREKLVSLEVTFGQEPELSWRLVPHPDASEEQRAHLAAWLDGGGE